MTTDKHLEAIEARLNAAGPGPWEWEAGATGVVIQTQHETAYRRAFVARIVAGSGAVVDLVAHAWGDLRTLAARVRALEARVRALEARVAEQQAGLVRSAERGSDWAEKAHQRRVALELAVKALSATVDRTTGYDWNADPDVVTRLQGDAFAAARTALEDQTDETR